MKSIDEAIKHCEEVAEKKEREAEYRQETQGDMFKFFDDLSKSVGGEGVENDALNECLECAKEHRQLAEWLKELKWYREDTRWADLYERICIKRDDDREYFARTKDKTYITRIAEKEMFIHMMQDMMFDRYGVEEVNADED